MGRSAKVHKRIKKSKSSGSHQQTSIPAPSTKPSPPTTTTISTTTPSTSAPPNAKRRTTLKDKATKSKTRKVGQGNESRHVLGGADYVELMMGSRRRAREEATKLPPPS